MELLSAEKIKRGLHHAFDAVEVFTNIDSTHQYLLTQLKNGDLKKRLCFAEQQTAGRGRHQRAWYSVFGGSLLFSLNWYFEKTPSHVSSLSIATAAAIIAAFEQDGISEKFLIKWPNDILWEQKKCAGILLDFQKHAQNKSVILIGVGINCHLPKTADIAKAYCDLSSITQQIIHRNQLAIKIVNAITGMLQDFTENNHWDDWCKQWQQRDALYQQPIQLQTSTGMVTGIGMGIGQQGELTLQLPNGVIQPFFTGSVNWLANDSSGAFKSETK